MMWRLHGCCQTIFKGCPWFLWYQYQASTIMILVQFWQFLTCYTTSGYIEHTPQFPYQVPVHLRGGWFQIITPLAAIAPRQALLLHHFFNSLHSFGTCVHTNIFLDEMLNTIWRWRKLFYVWTGIHMQCQKIAKRLKTSCSWKKCDIWHWQSLGRTRSTWLQPLVGTGWSSSSLQTIAIHTF